MSPSMSRRSAPACRVTATSDSWRPAVSTVPSPLTPKPATATEARTPTPAMTASLVLTRACRSDGRRCGRADAAADGGCVPDMGDLSWWGSGPVPEPAPGVRGVGRMGVLLVGEAADRGAQVGGHAGQLVDRGAGLGQRLR